MSEAVKTWRYHLKGQKEPYDSWTITFVDSTGCVSILSDYGNWGYRWAVEHTGKKDFREFLVDTGGDYVGRKIASHSDRNVFDANATRKALRTHILEARRSRSRSAQWARSEWDLTGDIDDDNPIVFHNFLESSSIVEAYEFAEYRLDHGLKHWLDVSFPRLQQAIREQLKAEAALTPSASAP